MPKRERGTGQHTLAGNVLAFGRLLRDAGLAITPEQSRIFGDAMARLGLANRREIKAAGRAIYVRRREEIEAYDSAFDLFFRRSTVDGGASGRLPRLRQADRRIGGSAEKPSHQQGTAERLLVSADPPIRRSAASRDERLRTIDFAELTNSESRDASSMIAALRPRLPRRQSRRPRLARKGYRLALRAMVRRSLATGGEALDWAWWRRTTRARPLTLVCDISGSMEAYSRFLLRFAHALTRAGARVETFVFGTRLTRITRELTHRNPDEALKRVSARVVDWNGGTRIGASLHQLNRRWVRRAIRNSAVVLIVSDGWERDDPAQLAREMETLRRSCHRIIWLDPLADHAGFEPATQGLLAALPWVDEFLPCGSVRSLEKLAESLARSSLAS
jgi:uncharacterized protein with von Willebrand factor type A (vWA) domain